MIDNLAARLLNDADFRLSIEERVRRLNDHDCDECDPRIVASMINAREMLTAFARADLRVSVTDGITERLKHDPKLAQDIEKDVKKLSSCARTDEDVDEVYLIAQMLRADTMLASLAQAATEKEQGDSMIDENYVYTPEHDPRAPAANGHRVNGPKIPRRTEWFTLPDEFGETDPPMKIKVWVTYPRKLIDDIRSGDVDRQKEALRKIVLEHNGWLDEEGDPMPPADTDKFWDDVPDIIAGAIIAIAQTEVGKAAASVMRRQKR